MDIDPIQERTSSINKIKQWFKSLFRKKKTEPDYEKVLQTARENAYKNYQAYSKFGMSCEQAAKNLEKMGKAFAVYNKFLTPNQMREILDKESIEDESILYADGKPYCIIKKGEPIWMDKNK